MLCVLQSTRLASLRRTSKYVLFFGVAPTSHLWKHGCLTMVHRFFIHGLWQNHSRLGKNVFPSWAVTEILHYPSTCINIRIGQPHVSIGWPLKPNKKLLMIWCMISSRRCPRERHLDIYIFFPKKIFFECPRIQPKTLIHQIGHSIWKVIFNFNPTSSNSPIRPSHVRQVAYRSGTWWWSSASWTIPWYRRWALRQSHLLLPPRWIKHGRFDLFWFHVG